ncbi:MAG: GIY-YIG nuclease family protein [Peptococcaceae bacterium]|jgi:putative endonuclease|nr:GIY-YIG nuclease family protein [Peptococcaceae bacterium]
MGYWVYLARCAGGKLYTGVTTDLERRMHEHNHTRKGAKYTAAHLPVALAQAWQVSDRGSALRLEAAMKKCSKKQKEQWIKDPESIAAVLRLTDSRGVFSVPAKAGSGSGIKETAAGEFSEQ